MVMKNIGEVKFREGIDPSKYSEDFVFDNSQMVWDLLKKYGYQEFEGKSAKLFTIPTKATLHKNKFDDVELTVSMLEASLERIEKLGLKNYFASDLSIDTLHPVFVDRVEWCKNNNMAFFDEENQTFLPALFDVLQFAEYTKQKPLDTIVTASEAPNMGDYTPNHDDRTQTEQAAEEYFMVRANAEDQQVMNDVKKKLYTALLKHPDDEFLNKVVHNTIIKIGPHILNKEYKEENKTLYDLVESVMFDGLDMEPQTDDNNRIEDIMAEEFGLPERGMAR